LLAVTAALTPVVARAKGAASRPAVAPKLAKIPGIRPIDAGKLENARIVEQITALLVGLNMRHKGHSGIRITGLPPAAYR